MTTPPPPPAEGWRAWAARLIVAGGLAAVVGLGGAAVGIAWPEAAGAGWATVGGWYISLSTQALGRVLREVGTGWGSGQGWPGGPLAALPSLGVWALAAGLTAMATFGPPLLVFGAVSVVVANVTFSVGALLRRHALVRADVAGVMTPMQVGARGGGGSGLEATATGQGGVEELASPASVA